MRKINVNIADNEFHRHTLSLLSHGTRLKSDDDDVRHNIDI